MKSTAKVFAEKKSCESNNNQFCYFETTAFMDNLERQIRRGRI